MIPGVHRKAASTLGDYFCCRRFKGAAKKYGADQVLGMTCDGVE